MAQGSKQTKSSEQAKPSPSVHKSPASPVTSPETQSLQSAVNAPLAASPREVLQMQRQFGNSAVQHLLKSAQPNKVQRSATLGAKGGEVTSDLQRQIHAAQGGGQALDRTAGSQIGQALGTDFSGVRVHTDSQSADLNRSLSAKAFTLGNDVFFSRGAYSPGTAGGKQLLAHELTHVAQQSGSKSNKVQTKLNVGPVGDAYEQEADAVAKQIGQGAPSFQKGLTPAPLRVRRSPITIQRTFQDRSEAFEKSLGVYAFQHPKANAAAAAMSDKVKQYIERQATKDKVTERQIDTLWKKAGSDRKDIGGSVGDKVEDIKKVFAKGNLRERMTHVYNFMEHHFGNVTGSDTSQLDEIVANPKAKQKAFDQQAPNTPEGSETYFGDVLHGSAPQLTVLSQQKDTRTRTDEDSSSQRTVGDVGGLQKEGGLLSKREARFMFGDVSDPSTLKDQKLGWSEGARVWKVNKEHWWVKTMQGLDLPLMAGPSAHTNAFMNIAKLLGVKDLASVRLAAIGQLLPLRAHSLVEIMAAAEGHGLSFTPGPEMYRNIAPLKQKELRQAVGKGQFPDEVGGEATGVGGDYRKLLNRYQSYFKLMAESDGEPDPHQLLKKLQDLDAMAAEHITKKQTEKAKLKGKPEEAQRLDNRIKGVEALREELKPKIAQAQTKVNLANSRKRIEELTETGHYKDKLFHGTHTGLLKGLGGSGGLLMSGAELERRGIVRSSGEGDFFSSGDVKGPKPFISVGLGEFGLGTALAYAQAAGNLKNYNIERYTDSELALELKQLQEGIDNYDVTLLSSMRKGEREYKSKEQLQNLYDRLEGERKYREGLPKEHPRRRGQLSEGSNFPLLFELDGSGLDVRDEGQKVGSEKPIEDLPPNERKGVYTQFLGERMVYDQTIDLKLRLVRVYCPAEKMDEVRNKLTDIVGHTNFEVLAIEALDSLPEEGLAGGTRLESYLTLEDFEHVRERVVAAYAQGMLTKQPIDNVQKLAKQYGSNPPPTVSTGKKDESPQQTNPPVTSTKPPETTKPEPKKPEPVPLEELLRANNLQVHVIDGNGNCLFASVLHQLRQTGSPYNTPQALRNALADHVLRLPVEFQRNILRPILQAENLSIEAAAARIRAPGYWNGLVGDLAPQFLADLLERSIHLYRPDGKQTLTPSGANTHAAISIVYNGVNHYNSTNPLAQPNVEQPVPQVSKIEDTGPSSIPELPPSGLETAKSEKEGEKKPEEDKPLPEVVSPPTTTDLPGSELSSEQSAPPLTKGKKGKPYVVLSGHGLLRDTTDPTKTKVPSNMSISFTGPMGSILDNPLANAIEEGRLKPEDIFVETVSLNTGEVTEIEPHEILKLYKFFGPRRVKGGNKVPNYTLTPSGKLQVSVNAQVITVQSETTLQNLFPKLQKQFPKGADIQWAACQDLPGIDREFQIKVMHKNDRFKPSSGFNRATTSGEARKAEIKKLKKMIKEFEKI